MRPFCFKLFFVLYLFFITIIKVDQDDVEEFLAVGKALRINGLNAKEQEQQQEQEQDTIANTPSIQHIKEEIVQGDNDASAECFKYTSETILGSSSGNNNEKKRSSKAALRKHKQIDYLELAGTQQIVNSKRQIYNFVFQVREQRTLRIGCLVTSVAS